MIHLGVGWQAREYLDSTEYWYFRDHGNRVFISLTAESNDESLVQDLAARLHKDDIEQTWRDSFNIGHRARMAGPIRRFLEGIAADSGQASAAKLARRLLVSGDSDVK